MASRFPDSVFTGHKRWHWPVVVAAILAATAGGPLRAQFFAPPQPDFSGEWGVVRNQDNSEMVLLGDWVGIPLNEAGLAWADSWHASTQSLPEWQCRPHGWAYMYRGLTPMVISREIDPLSRALVAYRVQWQVSSETAVFLDGRSHPPEYAPHTWLGYSTATWEGQVLKITTTHLKDAFLRRNGIPVSDQARVVSYWTRRGDYLTWINIVHDPVYLSEPLIRSGEYRVNTNVAPFPPHPCTPADEGQKKGVIPAYAPGSNPGPLEAADMMRIPIEAVRAGASTMYPEFRTMLRPR
jgi:hypothetical protein